MLDNKVLDNLVQKGLATAKLHSFFFKKDKTTAFLEFYLKKG
jgi:hypothetical protein